ncbi:DUF481 domain-containing protein [Aliarcobacter lanthieri]|uniref:DUF481 domain-containing protein n=1 Tax=Arcobacteraceae TaxID=2808963 RepID=UPI000DEB00DD|nr:MULTISPECIES: DUF481 domain-containing protein [Arcobacteraceae]MBL3519010.1 DUF481 domain-containing protein [Aliarcobacter lanthieri]RBQ26814.1 hypothetical protein CRU88_05165 [Arcobacter sp. CECT 9188]
MNNILKILLILSIVFSFSNAVDMDRRLELSYINTSGNTDTSSLSGKLGVNAKFDEREIKAKGSILRSKDNNKKSANKYELSLDYDHMIGDRLYTYLGAFYVNDEFSDYDSRLNIGPGLGYKFIYTDDEVLDLQGGFDYAIDKFDNGKKDEYVASKVELNYKYKIKENIEFKQMLSYLASMEDSKKYFVTSETGIAVKMMDNFSLGASYRLDYVNYTEKKKTDKKFLTSLIFDF